MDGHITYTMHLLTFNIYERGLYPASTATLPKHATHYGPRPVFPYDNLTIHTQRVSHIRYVGTHQAALWVEP